VHVFDLNENKHEPMCEQKIVRKAKLTRVSFNPKVKDKLTLISKPAALEIGAFRWSKMLPLSSKLEMGFFVITARSPIVIKFGARFTTAGYGEFLSFKSGVCHLFISVFPRHCLLLGVVSSRRLRGLKFVVKVGHSSLPHASRLYASEAMSKSVPCGRGPSLGNSFIVRNSPLMHHLILLVGETLKHNCFSHGFQKSPPLTGIKNLEFAAPDLVSGR
jgi:hypothetical protein